MFTIPPTILADLLGFNYRLKRKKPPKHNAANGRKKRKRTVTSPKFANVSAVSAVEVDHHRLREEETSINRVPVVHHLQLIATTVLRRFLLGGHHDERHHPPGEEDGEIGSESVERQTRTFRHAEDMNDVILTTVKAGAPDMDVPGQGHARHRGGEMIIAGAAGAHPDSPDPQNRAVIAETGQGLSLQIMDGNVGHIRQIEKAVIGTDHLRHHHFRHHLVLGPRDPRMNHPQGHQLGPHPGRETQAGENVWYLWSVEWIGGDGHLLTRSRMLMRRKEDVMNEAGVVLAVKNTVTAIHPRTGSKAKKE